jgi:hypothetical protein
MRHLALLAAAATFAACASDPPSAWTRIQRDRMERLHAPRDADAALAQVLRDAPAAAAAQEPRHIDQREPAAPGAGPRPYRVPLWTASARYGIGQVAVRVDGTRLDDRADAAFYGLGIDSSGGAGLQLALGTSDPELFAGQRINDGIAPAAADASLLAVDAFPHARVMLVDRDFRLPLRVGVFADWQQLEHERAGVQREWLGLGPRLALEPTVRLAGDRDRALDLVGHLAADVGGAWFQERFHRGDDRDETVRWSGEVGLGLRALLGSVHVDFGYRLQHIGYGAIDSELFGDRSSTELQQQQLFFGFGVTY